MSIAAFLIITLVVGLMGTFLTLVIKYDYDDISWKWIAPFITLILTVIVVSILMFGFKLGDYDVTEKTISVDVLNYIYDEPVIVMCDCDSTSLVETTTIHTFGFLKSEKITYVLFVPE